MKKLCFILFFFYSFTSFSQGEANIWYFGEYAGLDFNSGVPVALANGQLNTLEGCATLSNSAGQLLFYTDGITVYNRNHLVMPNGTGLMGDPSSAQSATIVQKPGSGNLFYVFTTDREHNPNGFRYSILDLNLDGGFGAVTSQKNVLVYTPTIENLGVTKHANGIDYWIVTHGWDGDSYNTYLLSSAGLSANPIVTNIGLPITGNSGFQAAGFIKLSPSGNKLAITSVSDFVQLFDFNINTGTLSNAQTLLVETGELYGVAFSPDESVLYVSQSFGKLYQFDLTSGNIPNSKLILYNNNTKTPGALQLGSDNKIYVAMRAQNKIGVINNPNVIGIGCDFQVDAVDLGGRICKSGLPSFNQSFFFSPAIQFENACVGEQTNFEFNTNETVLSAVWNFGDGNTSNDINANHTYSTPNIYTVSVLITTANGTGTSIRDITISEVPTATQPLPIKKCDNDNNGFFNFDLTQQNSTILNLLSATQYQIKYYANATDYANKVAISNPNSFENSVAYQSQNMIAEVYNTANSSCSAITNFDIQVFKSPEPGTNIPNLKKCDDTSVGNSADGKVIFNFTQNQNTILNGQSANEFDLLYFKDANFTNTIVDPSNYQNTNANENIYVKVVNKLNSNCFAVATFSIEVLPLPIINNFVSLKQCDDDLDGFSDFNLQEAIQLITSNSNGLTITFHESEQEAKDDLNEITDILSYTNQIVSNDFIFARVQNSNGCYSVAQINLIVSTTLIPSTFQKVFISCDDVVSGSNSDGLAIFDFSTVETEIKGLYPIGQQLNVTFYKNLTDALGEINSIINTSTYTNIGYPTLQNIYVRVDSQLNNECLGLGHHITLKVEKIPVVQPQIFRHCDDDQDGFFEFDTSNLQNNLLNGLSNVMVEYRNQSNIVLQSPFPNSFNTTSQIINVKVINNTTNACYFETTFNFIVDDLPEVFAIPTNLTSVCDDESDPNLQDGFFDFDTSTFQSSLLGNQTGMIINYYDENNNLITLLNPFKTKNQNIRVEVINPLNLNCKADLIIPFVINPIPNISLTGTELVCSNNPNFTKNINAGLLDISTINNFSYKWYFNNSLIPSANNYSLIINKEGIYKVEIANSIGCISTRIITVSASEIATINSVDINDFSDNNSIEINFTGNGNYVFSLNGEEYQTSNIFYNLDAGTYTVYVKDLKQCGIAKKQIYVLGAPKFFTPNGDGFNDYWNLKGKNQLINKNTLITIFDRFGKIIIQFNPISQGWDGTYNNQMLPSTDYWFFIQLVDGRNVKGHFSLKR